MPVDHFPSTHATWIDAQLTIAERSRAAGDQAGETNAVAALRSHLMERYYDALKAYVLGGSLRKLGDANDLVGGFFADRACGPRFLAQWRTSGLPLRRWMMTGVNLYGKSIIRDRTRDRERPVGDIEPESLVDEATAERAFERAWALSVLNAALAQVHAELTGQGRIDEYEIFRRRVIAGDSYAQIASGSARTEQQCAGATRLVTERLRVALRDVLRDEGVTESEVSAAISEVYDAFGIARRMDGGA